MYNLLCSLIKVLSSEYCITFHWEDKHNGWNNQNITQCLRHSLCVSVNINITRGKAGQCCGEEMLLSVYLLGQ